LEFNEESVVDVDEELEQAERPDAALEQIVENYMLSPDTPTSGSLRLTWPS
jgi:hypothetical protein